MLFALVHLVLRRLFGFAGGSESQSQSTDVEILVLRHQLKVLRRHPAHHSPRPAAYPGDKSSGIRSQELQFFGEAVARILLRLSRSHLRGRFDEGLGLL